MHRAVNQLQTLVSCLAMYRSSDLCKSKSAIQVHSSSDNNLLDGPCSHGNRPMLKGQMDRAYERCLFIMHANSIVQSRPLIARLMARKWKRRLELYYETVQSLQLYTLINSSLSKQIKFIIIISIIDYTCIFRDWHIKHARKNDVVAENWAKN